LGGSAGTRPAVPLLFNGLVDSVRYLGSIIADFEMLSGNRLVLHKIIGSLLLVAV
jgi:hypothetical protein